MFDAPHSQVLRLIAAQAVNTPDKVALVTGLQRVTYAQLAEHVEGAAAYLHARGIKSGDYILLSAQKELEFVYLYLAAHLLGIVNVVIDSAAPKERLDYIVGIVHPVAMFGGAVDAEGYDFIP